MSVRVFLVKRRQGLQHFMATARASALRPRVYCVANVREWKTRVVVRTGWARGRGLLRCISLTHCSCWVASGCRLLRALRSTHVEPVDGRMWALAGVCVHLAYVVSLRRSSDGRIWIDK